jgi:hypothetical protein
MNDARRYRMNAAECLLAAKTCEPCYRSSLLAISAAWYALAIQDEEIHRLLAKAEQASVQDRRPRPGLSWRHDESSVCLH